MVSTEVPMIINFSDDKLKDLKEAAYKKKVVKGIRETIRAIKKGIVKEVFLCTCEKNDFGNKYTNTVESFTKSYLNQEPTYIGDYRILRDIVFQKNITEISNMNSMKFEDKNCNKKGPKCYCAGIIE